MQIKLTRHTGGQAQTINVEIDPQGNVRATVEGVTGPACTEVSAFLDALGILVVDENTGDYYQQLTGQAHLYGGYGDG